jgi:hypothetical protein
VFDFTKEKEGTRDKRAQISVGKQAVPWTTGQFVLRTGTKAKSVKDYVVGTLMVNTLVMKEVSPSPQYCGHKNWKQDDVIHRNGTI